MVNYVAATHMHGWYFMTNQESQNNGRGPGGGGLGYWLPVVKISSRKNDCLHLLRYMFALVPSFHAHTHRQYTGKGLSCLSRPQQEEKIMHRTLKRHAHPQGAYIHTTRIPEHRGP